MQIFNSVDAGKTTSWKDLTDRKAEIRAKALEEQKNMIEQSRAIREKSRDLDGLFDCPEVPEPNVQQTPEETHTASWKDLTDRKAEIRAKAAEEENIMIEQSRTIREKSRDLDGLFDCPEVPEVPNNDDSEKDESLLETIMKGALKLPDTDDSEKDESLLETILKGALKLPDDNH